MGERAHKIATEHTVTIKDGREIHRTESLHYCESCGADVCEREVNRTAAGPGTRVLCTLTKGHEGACRNEYAPPSPSASRQERGGSEGSDERAGGDHAAK